MNNYFYVNVNVVGYLTPMAYANITLTEGFFFDIEHSLNVGLTDEIKSVMKRLYAIERMTVSLIDENSKTIEAYRLIHKINPNEPKREWAIAKQIGDKFDFDNVPYVWAAEFLKKVKLVQGNAMQYYVKALIKKNTAPVSAKEERPKEMAIVSSKPEKPVEKKAEQKVEQKPEQKAEQKKPETKPTEKKKAGRPKSKVVKNPPYSEKKKIGVPKIKGFRSQAKK